MARRSWLDEQTEEPLIAEYAQRLETFTDALADGIIESQELEAQEQRLVELMKEVEPELSDELHEKVTRLLCELSAYDIMMTLHSLQKERLKDSVG